jgi:hypothetical protein
MKKIDPYFTIAGGIRRGSIIKWDAGLTIQMIWRMDFDFNCYQTTGKEDSKNQR